MQSVLASVFRCANITHCTENAQMNTLTPTPPLTDAEISIAKQFLAEASMMRQCATDPGLAIAAANWEILFRGWLEDQPAIAAAAAVSAVSAGVH